MKTINLNKFSRSFFNIDIYHNFGRHNTNLYKITNGKVDDMILTFLEKRNEQNIKYILRRL
jgi:hypothetical protein